MPAAPFAVVRVSGRPYERGVQYGTAVAPQIYKTIEAYKLLFAYAPGWDWATVTQHARTYIPAIKQHTPHLLTEMEGIAAGAKLTLPDILAINVRSEIINTAHASKAKECTAFVAAPDYTTNGHLLIGQNWDWKQLTANAVIILEVEMFDGPNFVTIVEAGLLAKCGFNSAGIGLATNALNSSLDCGEAGLPYHIILRAILQSRSLNEARGWVLRPYRASAANYLIAHQSGQAFNIECAPGNEQFTFQTAISHKLYFHANHYLQSPLPFADILPQREPDTLFRQEQFAALTRQYGKNLSLPILQSILADHEQYPFGICCHFSEDSPAAEQYATIASIVMDLNSNTMWLAQGNPCQADYQERNYADFFTVAPAPASKLSI